MQDQDYPSFRIHEPAGERRRKHYISVNQKALRSKDPHGGTPESPRGQPWKKRPKQIDREGNKSLLHLMLAQTPPGLTERQEAET